MNGAELNFHVAELAVLVFGVAAPIIWSTLRLRSIFKDFPPHRHINGTILYPADYAPTEVERQER